ncbi:unnamed protein product [Peniophora sp. CBMAI 1063]|nr:unnamed protein product [Peniophora sp. CBMAI 1063]
MRIAESKTRLVRERISELCLYSSARLAHDYLCRYGVPRSLIILRVHSPKNEQGHHRKLPFGLFDATQKLCVLEFNSNCRLHHEAQLPEALTSLNLRGVPKMHRLFHHLLSLRTLKHLALDFLSATARSPVNSSKSIVLPTLVSLDVACEAGSGVAEEFFSSVSFPSTTSVVLGLCVTSDDHTSIHSALASGIRHVARQTLPLLSLSGSADWKYYEPGAITLSCYSWLRAPSTQNQPALPPILTLKMWWPDNHPINHNTAFQYVLDSLPTHDVQEVHLHAPGPWIYKPDDQSISKPAGLSEIATAIPGVTTLLLSGPLTTLLEPLYPGPASQIARVVAERHEWRKLQDFRISSVLACRQRANAPTLNIELCDDAGVFAGNILEHIQWS